MLPAEPTNRVTRKANATLQKSDHASFTHGANTTHTPDEHLAEVACERAVDVLFGVGELRLVEKNDTCQVEVRAEQARLHRLSTTLNAYKLEHKPSGRRAPPEALPCSNMLSLSADAVDARSKRPIARSPPRQALPGAHRWAKINHPPPTHT